MFSSQVPCGTIHALNLQKDLSTVEFMHFLLAGIKKLLIDNKFRFHVLFAEREIVIVFAVE